MFSIIANSTIGQGRKTTIFPRKEEFGIISTRQSGNIVERVGGGGKRSGGGKGLASFGSDKSNKEKDDAMIKIYGEGVTLEILGHPIGGDPIYKKRYNAVGLGKNATIKQLQAAEKKLARAVAAEEPAPEPQGAPEEKKSPWQQLLTYLLYYLTGRQENFSEGKDKREVFRRIIYSIIHLIILYYALKFALKCTKNTSDITKQTRQVFLRLLVAPAYLIYYFVSGKKC